MDDVGIIVDDLEDAIAFFVELALELERVDLQGQWLDRMGGLYGRPCRTMTRGGGDD